MTRWMLVKTQEFLFHLVVLLAPEAGHHLHLIHGHHDHLPEEETAAVVEENKVWTLGGIKI